MRDVSSDEGIAAFLAARVDEDQERAAKMRHYFVDEPYFDCPATRTAPLGDLSWGEDACNCGLAERKARALREVEAKREIMRWHYRGLPPEGAPAGLEICAGEEGDCDTWQMATPWPCPQIRAVVFVYADHPDYREEEWKPLTASSPSPPS